MHNVDKGGAPKGGRVHWFLLLLPQTVRENYEIHYLYDYHNYYLKRKRQNDYDLYIINRTSPRCWKMSYFDTETNFCETHSYINLYELIDFMLYKNQKKLNSELTKAIEKENGKISKLTSKKRR